MLCRGCLVEVKGFFWMWPAWCGWCIESRMNLHHRNPNPCGCAPSPKQRYLMKIAEYKHFQIEGGRNCLWSFGWWWLLRIQCPSSRPLHTRDHFWTLRLKLPSSSPSGENFLTFFNCDAEFTLDISWRAGICCYLFESLVERNRKSTLEGIEPHWENKNPWVIFSLILIVNLGDLTGLTEVQYRGLQGVIPL